MKTLQLSLFFTILFLFNACVGDDFVDDAVDPVIRITSTVDTIQIGEEYQFEAMYLNNIGQQENIDMTWASSNTAVLNINNSGLATALQEGNSTLTVTVNDGTNTIFDQINISVGKETVEQLPPTRTGTIRVTSNYVLQGNFELTEEIEGLKLRIDESYRASSGLPGLYIYLTNNPNTTANAYEIGMVNTFEGAHEFIIEDGIGINDYSHVLYFCKPFNVKIGDGEFVN
jgi:hypothetical protein